MAMTIFNTERLILTFLKAGALTLIARFPILTLLVKQEEGLHHTPFYMLCIGFFLPFFPAKIFPPPSSERLYPRSLSVLCAVLKLSYKIFWDEWFTQSAPYSQEERLESKAIISWLTKQQNKNQLWFGLKFSFISQNWMKKEGFKAALHCFWNKNVSLVQTYQRREG